MPKIKTHQGTAKRVRKSASGKIMHDRAFTHHKLQRKSGSRKRRLSIDNILTNGNKKNTNNAVN